jgi:hypothetical protein
VVPVGSGELDNAITEETAMSNNKTMGFIFKSERFRLVNSANYENKLLQIPDFAVGWLARRKKSSCFICEMSNELHIKQESPNL